MFGYYCDADGRVQRNGPFINLGCSAYCYCVNLGMAPNICPSIWTYCLAVAPNGSTIFESKPNSSPVNVTSEESTEALEDRGIHTTEPEFAVDVQSDDTEDSQFSMICKDKDQTQSCGSAPFSYCCTVTGELLQRPESVNRNECSRDCQCINLFPFVCPPILPVCEGWGDGSSSDLSSLLDTFADANGMPNPDLMEKSTSRTGTTDMDGDIDGGE